MSPNAGGDTALYHVLVGAYVPATIRAVEQGNYLLAYDADGATRAALACDLVDPTPLALPTAAEALEGAATAVLLQVADGSYERAIASAASAAAADAAATAHAAGTLQVYQPSTGETRAVAAQAPASFSAILAIWWPVKRA